MMMAVAVVAVGFGALFDDANACSACSALCSDDAKALMTTYAKHFSLNTHTHTAIISVAAAATAAILNGNHELKRELLLSLMKEKEKRY